jgi:cytosine deaminase
MDWESLDPRHELEQAIEAEGGWVNAHAHLDRSYIINRDNWHLTGDTLQAKWDYTDKFKAAASVGEIAGHMSRVIEDQLSQGAQAIGSFLDADSVVKDKSLRAAELVRDRYRDDIRLVFMNQPIKGLVDRTELAWFRHAADFVDIIGGLPEKDDDTNPGEGLGQAHLETIFSIAAEQDKPLHIHADQYNSPAQRDTELILDTIEAYGYAGRVSLIHCISLGAQPKDYRDSMYARFAELGVTAVCCPTSWIDSRRNEVLVPSHNAITPVDEMLEAGVRVAMGVDNIADIYKPFSDGDLWTEMRFLLEATHTYDIPALARIATTNGLACLGLAAEQQQLRAA